MTQQHDLIILIIIIFLPSQWHIYGIYFFDSRVFSFFTSVFFSPVDLKELPLYDYFVVIPFDICVEFVMNFLLALSICSYFFCLYIYTMYVCFFGQILVSIK